MNKVQYVQVAPCIPLKFGGNELYTYHSDQKSHISEGAVVRIPFGKRHITGVIVKNKIKKPRYPTKQIIKISDTILTRQQMDFARWLAISAHGGLGYTLRIFTI